MQKFLTVQKEKIVQMEHGLDDFFFKLLIIIILLYYIFEFQFFFLFRVKMVDQWFLMKKKQ